MFRFHIVSNIIILLCLFSVQLFAEDVEEDLFSLEDETSEANEMIESLQHLKHDPLYVNFADRNDLRQLLWLNDEDINIILKLQNEKAITSTDDLIMAGVNRLTVNAILPYISFKQKTKLSLFQQTRGEYRKAKEELPSCLKYYHKTLFSVGKLQAGFVSQKDEGETDPLDFYSAFLNYKNKGFVKQILAGHYRMGIGQGILFAPKLGMSKSAAATSIPDKKLSTLKPYTSSYEIWDLRGGAVIINSGNFELTPFYSNNDLAANLTDNKISSFNLSGVHSSDQEYVKEEIAGAYAYYYRERFRLGFTAARLKFDHKFADEKMEDEYFAFSLNGKFTFFDIPTFWEIATASQKYAAVGGVKWGDKKIRHLFLLRYYEKDFPTWHGKAFSAQSDFENELGFYFGSTIIPGRNVKINLYFDLWKHPESRYYEKLPTSGSEEFFQVEYNKKPHNLRVSVRHKSVDKYSSLDDVSMIRPTERTVVRVDWWQNIKTVRFKTRLEYAKQDLEGNISDGWLCYEELKFSSKRLKVILNYTVNFSDVLHYMYENGVDGVMQNRIMSGDGNYCYLLIDLDLNKHLTMQSKMAGSPDSKDSLAIYLQIITRF